MYEDGITVTYATVDEEDRVSADSTVTLPGWCAGEPDAALALYLFGRVDWRSSVLVRDWQPR